MSKHRPSKAELDERVIVPLDPKRFIEGVLAVDLEDEGDHDDEGPAK